MDVFSVKPAVQADSPAGTWALTSSRPDPLTNVPKGSASKFESSKERKERKPSRSPAEKKSCRRGISPGPVQVPAAQVAHVGLNAVTWVGGGKGEYRNNPEEGAISPPWSFVNKSNILYIVLKTLKKNIMSHNEIQFIHLTIKCIKHQHIFNFIFELIRTQA